MTEWYKTQKRLTELEEKRNKWHHNRSVKLIQRNRELSMLSGYLAVTTALGFAISGVVILLSVW